MSKFDHECGGCGCTINTQKHSYEYKKQVVVDGSSKFYCEHYFCSRCANLGEHDFDEELENDMNENYCKYAYRRTQHEPNME